MVCLHPTQVRQTASRACHIPVNPGCLRALHRPRQYTNFSASSGAVRDRVPPYGEVIDRILFVRGRNPDAIPEREAVGAPDP